MQTKLGTHITTQKGFAFKSEWYRNSGIPIVRVSDFTDDSIDITRLTCIPTELGTEYQRYSLTTADVVIQTVGSWPSNPKSVVGKAIKTPLMANGALLNQNAVRLDPLEDLDKIYLFYLLKNADFKNYIVGCAQGAASQASITLEAIREYSFDLPLLPTQRRIADILSAYDDLIQVNTRRIRILESMAQSIYRKWFRKVNIVSLPDGWKEKTIGDVLSSLESGSRPKGGIDSQERGIPSIGAENIIGLGQYNFSSEKFVTRDFYNAMTRGHIKSRDVLLYKDGASIGRKSMFRDGFPHNECCINEHVFILRTNEECTQNYLYFWLDQPDITQNIRNLNANAAQPGINQSGVSGLPIILPDQFTLKKFDELVDPILSLLFNLAKKNANLRKTRDLLLPRLVGGEIDV